VPCSLGRMASFFNFLSRVGCNMPNTVYLWFTFGMNDTKCWWVVDPVARRTLWGKDTYTHTVKYFFKGNHTLVWCKFSSEFEEELPSQEQAFELVVKWFDGKFKRVSLSD